VAAQLAEGIRKTYQRCLFYDVYLVAGKNRFPAHQAVLAASSPLLREQVCAMHRAPQTTEGSVAAAEEQAPAKPVEESSHPELHLPSTCTQQAVGALLDAVYGLGGGYSCSCETTNVEVLRLAQLYGLPSLRTAAEAWLQQDVKVENAIARLATCREFGLDTTAEAIMATITADSQLLVKVLQDPEAMKHPLILQSLLLSMANQGSAREAAAGGKRPHEEVELAATQEEVVSKPAAEVPEEASQPAAQTAAEVEEEQPLLKVAQDAKRRRTIATPARVGVRK